MNEEISGNALPVAEGKVSPQNQSESPPCRLSIAEGAIQRLASCLGRLIGEDIAVANRDGTAEGAIDSVNKLGCQREGELKRRRIRHSIFF